MRNFSFACQAHTTRPYYGVIATSFGSHDWDYMPVDLSLSTLPYFDRPLKIRCPASETPVPIFCWLCLRATNFSSNWVSMALKIRLNSRSHVGVQLPSVFGNVTRGRGLRLFLEPLEFLLEVFWKSGWRRPLVIGRRPIPWIGIMPRSRYAHCSKQ